jgi:hypothetical protein
MITIAVVNRLLVKLAFVSILLVLAIVRWGYLLNNLGQHLTNNTDNKPRMFQRRVILPEPQKDILVAGIGAIIRMLRIIRIIVVV